MITQRWRLTFLALLVVIMAWAIALTGYTLAKNSRVTADKLRAYLASVDFAHLTGEARLDALHRLADLLNRLPLEERRKVRLERLTASWFNAMTDQEKTWFIDATMPTGFKQMLAAFEQLPEDKRRKTIDDTLRRLRQQQARLQAEEGDPNPGTNGPPPLSPELQAQIRTIGLRAFYTQSSAQTKAELAPVIEELQRVMESGRPFRGP